MRAILCLLFATAICGFSQAADEPLPEFSVASVKPIDPKVRNGIDIKVLAGGRMEATAASLQQLIGGAYGGLEMFQVIGPAWIENARFNIEAKPPEDDFGQQPTVIALGRAVPLKTMLRLRALLIARFHLKTHFETRERTVYDLVTGKNGSKMKEGVPKNDGGGFCGGYRVVGNVGSIEAAGCTMPWLASRLSQFLLRTDVMDKTGLTGVYDFRVEFAPMGPFAAVETADADPSGAPTLFAAMQSLGLKLEARKGPVKVLVVDSAEKLVEN